MEIIQEYRYDIFSSNLNHVEISDDNKRAILSLPLMHVGPNKKGLFWTKEMLKKITEMFRGIPFRYDLNGQEGSSHTLNKLSSPHFDVGWTYSSEDGAWYDPKEKALWVQGEVTHPEVVGKLSRKTTDGKREVNYASMGVIVEESICSICGSSFNEGVCEKGHERNHVYDGETCYKVPTEVSKVLHAALTNDPADGEAEIKNVIIQELHEYEAGPHDKRNQAGEQMDRTNLSNQIPGGLAVSSPQTAQPGAVPSSEMILKNLAERIKTLEQKIAVNVASTETPELVNASPQDQFTQSNMGNTTQFTAQKQQEETGKMETKDAQSNNNAVSVNPEKPEMQDVLGDPMQQIMSMLQQILARLPGAETQDMGKEALDANKSMAKMAQDDIPTEHMGEGAVAPSEEEGNAKNKKNMTQPDKVENADNLKREIADMKEQMKAMRSKLEIQDNDIPEFGGSSRHTSKVDVADLGAQGRTEKFGEYGAWDSIFNGADSAVKFKR